MVKFLIYLFESGFCLAVMYLVYYFFLRKETYFVFNRFYLNAAVAISLLIPVLHISITVPDTNRIETPVSQIFRFRSYYEQVIALTDPGYTSQRVQQSPGTGIFEGSEMMSSGEVQSADNDPDAGRISRSDSAAALSSGMHAIRMADLILILYTVGGLFFVFRFLLLIYWLVRLTRKYGTQRFHGIKLVTFSEDMSPFSFFRFVFVNRDAVSAEDYDLVLAHEQVHIRQRHSLDLMIAQLITVIQWFNPFAWLVRDAIKSTHEYLADHLVVSQGFRVHDYQSLLLTQLITARPVELVNNFNLKPIKTRIAMMTKIRSGFSARLKALLVIPFALALFLLFADMSFRGPGKTVFNYSGLIENRQDAAELSGLWKGIDKDAYASLVQFKEGKMHLLEESSRALIYSFSLEENQLVLKSAVNPLRDPGIRMKYKLEDGQLSIWWSDSEVSRYSRTDYSNSMDYMLGKAELNIELPELSHYSILDQQGLTYSIFLAQGPGGSEPVLKMAGEKISGSDIGGYVEKERSKHKKIDIPYLTATLFIDRNVKMKYVHEIKHELRKINSLKFAAACIPADESVSPVLYHTVAQARLLPPMDAIMLDKEEVIKNGLNVFTLDLASAEYSAKDFETDFHEFLGKDQKYIIELVYSDEVKYGEYIEAVDMVFRVVFSYREKLALAKYNMSYSELPKSLQKEIRKVYPMTLTENYTDE